MATKLGRRERERKRLELAAKAAVHARRTRPECQGEQHLYANSLVNRDMSDRFPSAGASKPGSVLLKASQPYSIEREPKFRRVPAAPFKPSKAIREGSPKGPGKWS